MLHRFWGILIYIFICSLQEPCEASQTEAIKKVDCVLLKDRSAVLYFSLFTMKNIIMHPENVSFVWMCLQFPNRSTLRGTKSEVVDRNFEICPHDCISFSFLWSSSHTAFRSRSSNFSLRIGYFYHESPRTKYTLASSSVIKKNSFKFMDSM